MTVNCEYWLDGFCQNHYYGGRPSVGTCTMHCPEYKVQQLTRDGQSVPEAQINNRYVTEEYEKTVSEKSKGLGDTVKKWIEVVSFGKIKQKPDCGCKKRQDKLNKLFPYKDKTDVDAT